MSYPVNEDHAANEHVHHQERHEHEHSHETGSKKEISVGTDVLSKNNLLAERNRGWFEAKQITAINFVSSPGSGKTTLLEKLIADLQLTRKVYVIEGDQQTRNDADRIQAAGAKAIQINTGNGCHLDAHMINHAVKNLDVENGALLCIENVGNLVCPALFDLGEQKRIVIASTAEGEDKPLKYPNMFQSSDLCILNKTDLLPYLDFSVELFKENLAKVKPGMPLLLVSAKTGEGLPAVVDAL
jgi:hydrogenase nickel incorporation protein HypB